MNGRHQAVGRGGDDRARFNDCTICALPMLPQPCQSKMTVTGWPNEKRLFVPVFMLPFIESARRDYEAPMPEGAAERWLGFNPFGPGVDKGKFDLLRFGPKRNQSPMKLGPFYFAGFWRSTKNEDALRWCYVEALKEGRFRQLEGFVTKKTITELGETAAHHNPLIIQV